MRCSQHLESSLVSVERKPMSLLFPLQTDSIVPLKNNASRVVHEDDCQLYHVVVLDPSQEVESELKSNASPSKLTLTK